MNSFIILKSYAFNTMKIILDYWIWNKFELTRLTLYSKRYKTNFTTTHDKIVDVYNINS